MNSWSKIGVVWKLGRDRGKDERRLTLSLCAYRSRRQSGGEPSLQHSIPDRYFVVTNDELVRISHLLFFTQQLRYSLRHIGKCGNEKIWQFFLQETLYCKVPSIN